MNTNPKDRTSTRSSFASATGGFVATASRATDSKKLAARSGRSERGQDTDTRR